MVGKRSEVASANKLSIELEGDRTIIFQRAFNAPAKIVFDAWTNADLVRRWWAPRSSGTEMLSCEADVRVGGKYRYVLKNSHGQEVAFSGVYREITPHTRLVYTSIFEMFPDAPTMITVTFTERDGKTMMHSEEIYASAGARTAAVSSGMEQGVHENLAQLDELVMELA